MNVTIRHLKAQELETQGTGVFRNLPGQFSFGFIPLHPPVAEIEKDAPPRSVRTVGTTGMPDGTIDKNHVTGSSDYFHATTMQRDPI